MTGSPKDQRHHDPASGEVLAAEFPGWHVWEGVAGTGWYARLPRTSPPVVLHAADLGELRDMLIGWRWKNSGGG